MTEIYSVQARHGRGSSWSVKCANCGHGIYLGQGAKTAIERRVALVSTPLCERCESQVAEQEAEQ